MTVLISSLPSGGKTLKNKSIKEVVIEPLTYRQIIKYSQATQENPITKMIFDIENLVKDIPNWEYLSAYDLSGIMFTRKYITATTAPSVKVEVGGSYYEIKMSDITFKDINDEYLNMTTVKLNNKEYNVHVPTIEEYYNLLKAFEPKYKIEPWVTPYDMMIFASLGATPDSILDYAWNYGNVKGDDIVTVEYLDKVINNITNDITIKSDGGDTVISVDKLITDFFRFISINRRLDDSAIKFK